MVKNQQERKITMARCYKCDKKTTFGKKISVTRSHVSGRSNRKMKPNLKRIRIMENGAAKRVYMCTKCMRSGDIIRA